MKTGAKIYAWAIIGVIIQVSILVYVNDIFLTGRSSIKATSFATMEKQKEDVKVKIPQEASDFKVSFDGSYMGYIKDGNLVIIDLANKKEKKTIIPEKGILSYYRWLPDRNMVIYALCAPESQPGSVQYFTYEIDSDYLRENPKISNLPKGSRIEDIELSPQTNVVYIKVRTSETRAIIYKFNVMNTLSFIMNASSSIVIKETGYNDKLVYQDSKNRIYVRDGAKGTSTLLPLKNKGVLLEIDSEDRVYVGELNKENKVAKIYYGRLNTNFNKEWSTISLKKTVNQEDIYITQEGNIYELDETNNTLYNLTGGDDLTFKGNLVEVLDDYIVSINNNEVLLDAVEPSGKLKK